jgi:hypothetical protein
MRCLKASWANGRQGASLSLVTIALLAAGCGRGTTLPTSPTITPPPSAPAVPAPIPAGPIAGIVKDGHGDPIADVIVSGPTVPTTTTDGSGRFSLPAPVCPDGRYPSTALSFDKAGYVEPYPYQLPCPFSGTLAVTLQPLILMSADARVDTTLYKGDPDLYLGDFCGPCKEILVHVDHPTTVTVHLHVSAATRLGLWIFTNGSGPAVFVRRPDESKNDISADVDMTPSFDTQVYVGTLDDTPLAVDVPFDVTTSVTQ